MPKISVIVPVYNTEKYLHRCIDSILAQTFTDFEVLLIDDGSTDSSGEICDEYASKDSRVRVFHKANGGVSSARNLGLDNTLGEWVTFVDSDDWVEKCFFNIFQQPLNVDYILFSYNKVDDKGVIHREQYPKIGQFKLDKHFFVQEIMLIGFFTPWAKFFKRSILQEFGIKFDTTISSGEDTIFIYRYMVHVDIVYLSNDLCYNWRELNGLSSKNITFDNVIYTIDKTIHTLEKLENSICAELSNMKYNGILYLLSKVSVQNLSFWDLYQYLKLISTKKWLVDLICDRCYVNKGKRRACFDKLMSNGLLLLLTIWCKLTRNIY